MCESRPTSGDCVRLPRTPALQDAPDPECTEAHEPGIEAVAEPTWSSSCAGDHQGCRHTHTEFPHRPWLERSRRRSLSRSSAARGGYCCQDLLLGAASMPHAAGAVHDPRYASPCVTGESDAAPHDGRAEAHTALDRSARVLRISALITLPQAASQICAAPPHRAWSAF